MPRRKDQHTTDLVAQVDALLGQDPTLSARAACDAVGVAESTYRSRHRALGNPAPRGIATPGDIAESHQVGDITIPVVTRDLTDEAVHYVYPLGDIHKGSPAHARDKWREWLGYFADEPLASLIFTGDGLNAALRTSVSDVYTETMTVGEAKRELRDELRPLAERGQIDAMLPGNHEARIHRAVGDCPILDIADMLDITDRYAAAAILNVYQVGEVEYEFYTIHGTGGGGRPGARANKLDGMQRVIDADVYIMAHAHSMMNYPQQRFKRIGETVERRTRSFVGAGSFMGYEAYAATAGYAPQKVGAPRIRLDGRKFDVHVST